MPKLQAFTILDTLFGREATCQHYTRYDPNAKDAVPVNKGELTITFKDLAPEESLKLIDQLAGREPGSSTAVAAVSTAAPTPPPTVSKAASAAPTPPPTQNTTAAAATPPPQVTAEDSVYGRLTSMEEIIDEVIKRGVRTEEDAVKECRRVRALGISKVLNEVEEDEFDERIAMNAMAPVMMANAS